MGPISSTRPVADPHPVKVQIADDLREQITSGAYAPGDKLPPVRELALEYHVVTGTVRDTGGGPDTGGADDGPGDDLSGQEVEEAIRRAGQAGPTQPDM